MDSATPTFALSRFIEHVHDVAPKPGRTLDVEQLPNGRTTLVFRVLEAGGGGDVAVAGPRTHARSKHAKGVARVVMVQFKPGWSGPLLGVATSALTDRTVLLEDVWGSAATDLCLELLGAPDLSAIIDRLGRALALRSRQTFESASARLARQAVRLLEGGEVRVESVAAQLGVTARHLRRTFTEHIGVGPKEYARCVRLQRALRSAATSKDWARIATESGYYDQAHLISDFQKLVGVTPGAFAKRHAA